MVRTQVARRLNAPVASSAGRLFDAAASLLGIRDVAEFEAQAAIDLETAAGDLRAPALPWRLDRVDGLLVYDPRPTLRALLAGVADHRRPAALAAAFHATVAEVTRAMLARGARPHGRPAPCASRAACSRTGASPRTCCAGWRRTGSSHGSTGRSRSTTAA